RMQAGASNGARLVRLEDTHDQVLVPVVAGAEGPQPLVHRVEGLRLVRRPRHPRPQMLEAAVDGVLEERCVLGLPAPDDETLGLDSVRRHSHSIVAGGFEVTSRTTRFTAEISLTIREAIVSIRSCGRRAQSA